MDNTSILNIFLTHQEHFRRLSFPSLQFLANLVRHGTAVTHANSPESSRNPARALNIYTCNAWGTGRGREWGWVWRV